MPKISDAAPSTGFATGRMTFGRNLGSNLALIGVSLGIGIWFVPYLVGELGTERYGFLPLTANVISFLSIPTAALSLAANRGLTLALGRDDGNEARVVFTTSLLLMAAAAAVMVAPVLIWSLWPEWFHRVPAALEAEVGGLCLLAGGAFLIGTTGIVFQSVAQATNRLDLHNGVLLLQRLTRIGVTIALFTAFSPTLISAGWALVVAAALELVGHAACWRNLGPDLAIGRRFFDRSIAREFGGQSVWLMLATLGGVLLLGADVILVNRLLGPEATTDYSLALQWAILLRLFAGSLSGALHPTLVRMHATDTEDHRLEVTQRSMKFVGFAVAITAGGLCGLAEPFLELWLGEEFARLAPLIVLLVAPASVYLAIQPLYSVLIAADRLRMPGIVTVAAGILSVALAIIVTVLLGWGTKGIAIAVGIVLLLRNAGFYPIYTARVLGARPMALWSGLIKVAIAFGVFWGISWSVNQWLQPTSWLGFLAIAAGLGTIFLVGVLFLGLNRHDRVDLKTWLTRPPR